MEPKKWGFDNIKIILWNLAEFCVQMQCYAYDVNAMHEFWIFKIYGCYNWHKGLQQYSDSDEFIWSSRPTIECFGYSSLSYSTKIGI
jgi:hypothetical protein